MKTYLPAMAVATCLGLGKAANAQALFAGDSSHLRPRNGLGAAVGGIDAALPELPEALRHAHDSRNNRLILALIQEIRQELQDAVRRFGSHRIAVVLGTSTSGIAEGGAAIEHRLKHGSLPGGFAYSQQETGSPARFAADYLGLSGPAFVVATACSSSAKVFASARRLIAAGLADAALVGGADTICAMTVAGFSSLEAMSQKPCLPFKAERDGITIGEGGALFLMTKEPAPIALTGIGETSDAHHISAPDPDGAGAIAAISSALAEADAAPDRVGYVNLHGTATKLNDAMESRAVNAVFGPDTPCSSTKALTGHTLGAAGAVEAAFLWLSLSDGQGRLPPQAGGGTRDPDLADINLVRPGQTWKPEGKRVALSTSFAFGGSNCALVLERCS